MRRKRLNAFGLISIAVMMLSGFSYADKEITISKEDNENTTCPIVEQNTSKDYLWACPAINLNDTKGEPLYFTELVDIDYEKGRYSCDYSYKKTSDKFQSCNFTSTYYSKMKQTIAKNYLAKTGEQIKLNPSEPLVREASGKNARSSRVEKDYLKIEESDFNIINVPTSSYFQGAKEKKSSGRGRSGRGRRGRGRRWSVRRDTTASSSNIFFSGLYSNLNTSLGLLSKLDNTIKNKEVFNYIESNNVLDQPYLHLVMPYMIDGGVSSVRAKKLLAAGYEIPKKDYNFAKFVVGLLSLDPNVVKGYEDSTGKLMIQNNWLLGSTSVSAIDSTWTDRTVGGVSAAAEASYYDHVKQFWDDGAKERVMKANVASSLGSGRGGSAGFTEMVSSYVDIFEMKLWGWYYNMQKYFDIGYDLLSMMLLYSVFAWLVITSGTKGLIQFALRKKDDASSSMKITEDQWKSTLISLLVVSVFWISPNSKSTSTIDTPLSMMKGIIRESLAFGSYTATMFADLGLYSFIEFIVKKQQIFDISEIKSSFDASIKADLTVFYPAFETVLACREYYMMTDKDFLNSMDEISQLRVGGVLFPQRSSFAKNNNLNAISYNLCKKAYTISYSLAKTITQKTVETNILLKGKDDLMKKAVSVMIENNIRMEERLGWINIISVPITYFMMKNNDMFLSKGNTIEEIQREIEKQESSMNIRSVLDAKDGENFSQKFRILYGKLSNGLQSMAATVSAFVVSLSMYQALPGFSSIQGSIADYANKVYGDLLEIHMTEIVGSGDITPASLISNLIGSVPGVGFVKVVSKWILGKDGGIKEAYLWRTLILLGSFLLAISIWKMTLVTFFLNSLAILTLVKVLMYFLLVIVHIFSSVMMIVWAFGDTVKEKMITFAQNTAIIIIMPTLIVVGAYLSIFVYEMISVLYTFILGMNFTNIDATISLMGQSHSDVDQFSAYFQSNVIRHFGEMIMDLFAIIVTMIVLFTFPKTVLKRLGLDDIDENSEVVNQKISRHSDMTQ